MSDDGMKLGVFLREVSNWDWETFCRAESDPKYSSNEASIFALIRACVMEKMDAIKLALNRLDGKLKTPVRIEMPKVFYLYPNATLPAGMRVEQPTLPTGELAHEVVTRWEKKEVPTPDVVSEEDEVPLEELSLRQTLGRMAEHPRQVPEAVIDYAIKTQQWLLGKQPEPEEKPMVKSVVAAHLLKLAAERNIDALNEVFDQVDGKLVETIQVLGEDIYITDYSLTAPDAAYLNDDGILQLEATQSQETWAQKLGK